MSRLRLAREISGISLACWHGLYLTVSMQLQRVTLCRVSRQIHTSFWLCHISGLRSSLVTPGWLIGLRYQNKLRMSLAFSSIWSCWYWIWRIEVRSGRSWGQMVNESRWRQLMSSCIHLVQANALRPHQVSSGRWKRVPDQTTRFHLHTVQKLPCSNLSRALTYLGLWADKGSQCRSHLSYSVTSGV